MINRNKIELEACSALAQNGYFVAIREWLEKSHRSQLETLLAAKGEGVIEAKGYLRCLDDILNALPKANP